MKIIASTPREIIKELDLENPNDYNEIRMFRKYRHLLLQTSGYGIIGIGCEDVGVSNVLQNSQLLSLITKLRAHTSETSPKPVGEQPVLSSVLVRLDKGPVHISDFNTDKFIFCENQNDVLLESNLVETITIRLYIYNSPYVTNTVDENKFLLIKEFGNIDNMIIFDSNHSLINNLVVDRDGYSIRVNSPYTVQEVLNIAKNSITNEITSIL